MLKIKLAPRGKKHQITYRIVIAESRSKINSNVVDDIGFYTPQIKKLEIDKTKLADWQKKGAQITIGVDRLLNPDKYPAKPSFRQLEKANKAKSAPVEAEVEKEVEETKEVDKTTEDKPKETQE